MHEVSETIDTYSQTCWSCLTYCSSKVFLYSEKSSSLLPWCAEWWGCGRWWTVSLWTTGSPLCSVSASLRFVVHLFCASSLCKTEATLLFIVTSLAVAGCSWECAMLLRLFCVFYAVKLLQIHLSLVRMLCTLFSAVFYHLLLNEHWKNLLFCIGIVAWFCIA